jgi:hypothetical protein
MPLAPAYTGPNQVNSNATDGAGRTFLPGGGLSADINTSSAGDNIIVAAKAGVSHYVYGYRVIADSSNQVGWKDGAAAFVEGPMACGGTSLPGGAAPSVVPPGWLFKTSPGNALILNLASAVHVGGGVSYWDDIP